MKKWKIAFWCCLTILVLITIISAYSIIDQAYALTYQKVYYTETESDFENLIEIINKTDLSRIQIENVFKNHADYEYMDFQNDTISLNRISLIFKNGKLKTIIRD
ncbi:hypothetical protein SAMN04487989_1011006 [Bizionia echini]|uniref:Uncharacterized protein n=1 Tax=Bizionia echini TaxID=649333 RepID=A0A1I4ZRH2_9FLAO|nr:hypothetical protein [Bizionia echini]SFN52589.1 hypothetical protein SAMN04487989_1011006 [Bizionia echini]